MFKSRKKRQQQKLAEAEAAAAAALAAEAEAKLNDTSKYSLLDDIHLAHDFRSSVILTQLNKDLDVNKLTTQQKHLEQLRDLSHSPISPPLSPSSQEVLDGSRQYQDLAAWRHERSQNRYSNGLFGGKQRGRPKPKKYMNSEFIGEDEEVTEEEEEEEEVTVPAPAPASVPAPVPIETVIENKMVSNTIDLPTMIQEQDFDFSDDEEPIKEMYEPDSDTEENFFFQDFSNETNNNNKKKKKNQSRQRATKALSRFDLSSFARDLHDHRLSVIQPRDSKIIMTEDDELELEKLLEKQRQRMSMMTFVSESSDSLIPPPPMPSLDIIKSHQKSTITNVKPIKEVKEELLVSLPLPPLPPPELTTLVTNDAPIKETPLKEQLALVEEESPIKEIFPIIKQENIQIKKLDLVQQEDEFIINTAPSRPLAPPRPSIPLRPSVSAAMPTPKIDQLKRSVSTTSMNSNNRLPFIPPVRPNASLMRSPSKLSARKSSSMDQIHTRLVDENEPSVTSAALDWIAEDSSQDPTSFLYKKAIPLQQQQQQQQPTETQPIKSRGLFGSFRQVSRNKTHSGTSIKGLVRNFSSSNRPKRDSGMSRAAMAVLQHNASKQEPTTMEPVIEQRPSSSRSRVKSDVNLISNLLSRAASSSSKRHNQTKIVNMEEENAKKRAQVVRRTIIYVQPDSLHDILKNGGSGSVPATAAATDPPPLPKPRKQTRNTMLSDSSLSPDDETVRSKEYVTATKIVRQTSVRKRIVEDPESSNGSISTTGTLSRHGSRRRYQLKSVEESEKKHSSDSSVSDNSDYLEGVELREMSDGSVVWGLVKKEGNRKSFYAPNQFNGYEQVEEEEEAEEEEERTRGMKRSPTSSSSLLSSSPPPIPKRSPRRQETTDIYYSNQMTLPSLLKMMQDQHLEEDSEEDYHDDEDDYRFKQRAMASVDDQLDEMMRILTSPQQQQQQQH